MEWNDIDIELHVSNIFVFTLFCIEFQLTLLFICVEKMTCMQQQISRKLVVLESDVERSEDKAGNSLMLVIPKSFIRPKNTLFCDFVCSNACLLFCLCLF